MPVAAGPARRAPVRILLVDDSPVALMFLKRMIESTGEVTVVGTAANGVSALEAIPRLDPEVVCTDLHMPDMDGLELTRRILAEYPRPVLVISASTHPEDSHNVFRLLEAGAIDVMPKPTISDDTSYEATARELVSKIKILAGVFVFRRRQPAVDSEAAPAPTSVAPVPGRHRLVVVGASTGGPQVLREIFQELPADYPFPVLCVQHISPEFMGGFVEWLQRHCAMDIRLAEPGELPQAGRIYMPHPDRHLEVGADGRFIESLRPMVDGHRPSVTVAMTSASRAYGGGTIGVLLSGMGRDGADGMVSIATSGGTTIVQDEASSTVFGMPKQAIELGAAQYVMNPGAIARKLLQLASR